MQQRANQKIPSAGPEREILREKGQFWTPSWLAETIAAWAMEDSPAVLFDPAVGPGTFFAAARRVGFPGRFAGFELHPHTLSEHDSKILTEHDFKDVVHADFIHASNLQHYPAIISNPPYIRHHRLSPAQKEYLRRLAKNLLGFPLDGRVGLHMYFLLKCLHMLSHGGRLAFLLPADVCEGVSSSSAWSRICERFRLEAVLTFSERAAPFPQVDTNAMVFFISNLPPKKSFTWLRVEARNPAQILASLRQSQTKSREIVEALATGLSRPPKPRADGVPLSSLARIVRGIATGANDFFFLTKQRLFELGLEQRWFIRAIGRTRDCRQPVLTGDVLEALDRTGRATWLLNLGSEPKDRLPKLLRDYLAEGEASGLPDRALISTRRPWYKMERREPPALLFAYLGRRDCRFILNRAAAVPLTGFLCVYPFDTSPDHVERLWRAVNHPDTVANLQFAAKSYGSGALKAEPRQLDKLLIPRDVLKEVGLNEPANEHATELFPTLLSAAV